MRIVCRMAKNPSDYMQLAYGFYTSGKPRASLFMKDVLQLTDEEISMLGNADLLPQLMEHKVIHRLIYYNLSDYMVLPYYTWSLHVPIDRYRKHKRDPPVLLAASGDMEQLF